MFSPELPAEGIAGNHLRTGHHRNGEQFDVCVAMLSSVVRHADRDCRRRWRTLLPSSIAAIESIARGKRRFFGLPVRGCSRMIMARETFRTRMKNCEGGRAALGALATAAEPSAIRTRDGCVAIRCPVRSTALRARLVEVFDTRQRIRTEAVGALEMCLTLHAHRSPCSGRWYTGESMMINSPARPQATANFSQRTAIIGRIVERELKIARSKGPRKRQTIELRGHRRWCTVEL